MDFKFFITRIVNLILDPVKEWETIFTENKPLKDARNSFLLPLILAGAISAFLGTFLFSHSELKPAYFILTGIKYILLMLFTVYFTALIFREITKTFDLKSDFPTSFKLIVFSSAPLLLCQILSRLFESFIFVNILSFYGLYVFWTGVEKMIRPPEHKRLTLMIATGITFIGTFFLTNMFLTRIFDKLYFVLFA